MPTVNLPAALDSALQSLSAQCQLSSWDVRGKGKFTTVVIRFNADTAMSGEQPPARAVSYRRKSPSELKRDQQRAIARQQHIRQQGDTVRSNEFDTKAKQETASTVDPEPALFYSPHHQVDTAALDENNAAKDEDRQVGDCDQSPELCDIDLPEATGPSAVTLPENMEESQAILEEWENDREATLTYLESHGDDVFDSVVLSASRTGPVLKKTVLDCRYGHYSLLGLTEDFVFVYDMVKGTVSDYFLVSVDYGLDSTAAQTLDCVNRWTEADGLRFAPQISRLKAHVRACYSHITQSADNSDVLSEPEQEN